MTLWHWQGLEVMNEARALPWVQPWFSALRAPRPLIMIRYIRAAIKFHLPRNRLQQIFKSNIPFQPSHGFRMFLMSGL